VFNEFRVFFPHFQFRHFFLAWRLEKIFFHRFHLFHSTSDFVGKELLRWIQTLEAVRREERGIVVVVVKEREVDLIVEEDAIGLARKMISLDAFTFQSKNFSLHNHTNTFY
jgi:hypothetical protein